MGKHKDRFRLFRSGVEPGSLLTDVDANEQLPGRFNNGFRNVGELLQNPAPDLFRLVETVGHR